MPFDRRLFASGMLAFVALGSLPSLYGVGAPIWSERFHLGPGAGGTAFAAHAAGALASVLLGLLGLRGLTLPVGLGVMGAGAALMAWAPTWGATLGGAMVAGMGFGVVGTVVNRRFLHDFGRRGPGMLGLVNAVTGVGAVAAPLLVVAAGERVGPVLLGLALLCALVVPLCTPEPARPSEGTGRGLPPLRDPRLLLLLFVSGAVAAEALLVGLGASALIDLGRPEAAAARLTSAFFAAFMAARVLLFWGAGMVPAGALFALGVGGTALCAALVPWAAAPAFVAAGAFIGVTWPSFYVWLPPRLGGDPRLGAAVILASQVGAVLGPLALRPILARTGDGGMFGAVAILAAILLLAFLALTLRRPQGSRAA